MTSPLRYGSAYVPAAGAVAGVWSGGTAWPVTVNPVLRAALYLFVMSIPFEVPDRSIIPIEVPTITGVLFLAATLLNPSAAYRRIPRPLPWFAAYLWIFLVIWALLANEHFGETLRLFANLVLLIAILWVMYNLLADARVLRGVLLAIVVSITARALMQWFGIAATTHEVWTGGERVTVLGQNANLSALILSTGLVTVLGLRGTRARWLPRFELLGWPLAATIGVAIIQTGSRGGLLCAGAGVLVFFFRGGTLLRRLRNTLVGIAAVALLGWGALQSQVMRGRLEGDGAVHMLAGRELIYPALVQMFSERPLLGWGPVDNQYEIARRIQEQKKPSRDAHNLVGELLTSTGLVGAVPFLIGVAMCIRAAWRARAGLLGALPLAVLTTVLVGTISGTWIASKILWLSMTLALAADVHWGRDAVRREESGRCAA
jgi:O-antigen ligase